MRKVGSMEQLAYARRIQYTEGRAQGLHAVEVKSGLVNFKVALDKCMDIAELSYRGVNLTFLSKAGLQNRQEYDAAGFRAQKSIMGGLFFTCGTDNVGTPDLDSQLPMHGSLRSTPAESVSIKKEWVDGEYQISLSGQMRQCALFQENVVLHRTITTVYGKNEIHVLDEFENQGYTQTPFLLLYHCNMGYPFLDTNMVLNFPTKHVTHRQSGKSIEKWSQIEEPEDDGYEEVFFHEMESDEEGMVSLSVENPNLNIGLELSYSSENLPRFTQWKSMVSGDYVLGLEPCNCGVDGRKKEEENHTMVYLQPKEKKKVRLRFRIFDL